MSKNKVSYMEIFIWAGPGDPSCSIEVRRENGQHNHYNKDKVSKFLSKAVHDLSRDSDFTVHVIPHTLSTSLFIYNAPEETMHFK